MLKLEEPAVGATTNLSAPLDRIVKTVKKRGLMVLISDLLAPVEPLESTLSSLAAFGHDVMVFHLLDPAELSFSFEKPIVFHDIETGRQMFIDPAIARKNYMKKLGAHNSAVEATCQKLGVGYRRFGTDRPLELALFDFLQERMRRGKPIKRQPR